MSSWTPQRVLDAAATMEWRPAGAVEVLTDEYHLIRYPAWALDPTFPAAQVTRSRTDRPGHEVIDEVLEQVRGWGLLGVAWWVSAATRPPGTEQTLRALGAKRVDAVQILARELAAGLPELDVPPEVTVELATDERSFRAALAVAVRGWRRKEPGQAQLDRELAEAVRDLADWTGFRVLARVDGEPACSGGCTLDGEVAKLWGAVTLPAFGGAAATGPCSPSGSGWPATMAPPWPWSKAGPAPLGRSCSGPASPTTARSAATGCPSPGTGPEPSLTRRMRGSRAPPWVRVVPWLRSCCHVCIWSRFWSAHMRQARQT